MLTAEDAIIDARGEATVILPGAPHLSDSIVEGVRRSLANSFPILSISLGEMLGGVDLDTDDFVVVPTTRVVKADGKIKMIGAVPLETCDEIAEALQAFRAAGWQRCLH